MNRELHILKLLIKYFDRSKAVEAFNCFMVGELPDLKDYKDELLALLDEDRVSYIDKVCICNLYQLDNQHYVDKLNKEIFLSRSLEDYNDEENGRGKKNKFKN